MAAGGKSIGGVAVFKKYSGLTIADNKLGAEFEVGGTLLREAVNHFFPGRVNPFDYFD
jgi:hypothetical protein